jgi:FkbM family methyltransferase
MMATETIEHNGVLSRVRRFLHRPFHEQTGSLYARWVRMFPNVPMLIRLPFKAWFIARNDAAAALLVSEQFENAERRFTERFLEPGMTVLDLGAHQGLYTLLASKLVGQGGKVFAFEPSSRERRALQSNVRLNRCKNVTIESFAVGDQNTDTDLYVAEPLFSGCSSLKPPAADIPASTTLLRVRVVRIDDWIIANPLNRVDFIKLDVEGGELSALKGAQQLLQRTPRPVILAEVQDTRTFPWGYRAEEIIRFLELRSYKWFGLTPEGDRCPLDTTAAEFEGNFVAYPQERLEVPLSKEVTSPQA